MKEFPITERHRNLKRDLDRITKRHSRHLADAEMLAIISQVSGMIIALQTAMTPDQALQVVIGNIEIGHSIVLNNLRNTH